MNKNQFKDALAIAQVSSIGWELDSWSSDQQVKLIGGIFFAAIKFFDVKIAIIGKFALNAKNLIAFTICSLSQPTTHIRRWLNYLKESM